MKSLKDTLAGSYLFKDVGSREIDVLLQKIPYTIKNYHAGGIIRFQGDEYDHLCIIVSGEVDAHIRHGNGKTIKIESLKAPDPLAAGILFADNNYLPVTVTAKTDASLLNISRETVLYLCRQYRSFLLAYMKDMGNKIVFLAEKIKHFQFNTIRQKIASYLLEQRSRQRLDSVTLSYTKETLAEIFGVTRPALSRVFGELAEDGIIQPEGKLIHLLKPDLLAGILDEGDEA